MDERDKIIQELNSAYEDCRDKLQRCRIECERLRVSKLTVGKIIKRGKFDEVLQILDIQETPSGVYVIVQ